MDLRWQPFARDAQRAIGLQLFAATSSPAAILRGDDAALADLTALASRIEQTEAQLTFTLVWHRELEGASMLQPGQWVQVTLDGVALCVQQVESLSDYRIAHGVKQVTVVARSRDATGRWRDRAITTRRYAIGAPALQMVIDVARTVGLGADEILVLQFGVYVPRADMQLTGASVWSALEQVMLAGGLQPFVDALGRLRGYSRDVLRAPDVLVDDDRLEGFTGSRSRAPVTTLQLRWRDGTMDTIIQEERELGRRNVLGGYFKMRSNKKIYFSEDHTQRAAEPRLQIDESINHLLPAASEAIAYICHDSAKLVGVSLEITQNRFVPGFIGTYIFGRLAMAAWPDFHNLVTTISYGRYLEAGWDMIALISFLSVGEGKYRIMGKPLDAVQSVNTTVAIDPAAPVASAKLEVVESDFIANEPAAVGYVTREFIYRSRAATSWSLTIVDDPRIERGDIVQLQDGTRVFVTGFRRDLSAGAPALLDLTGFPA